MNDTLEHVIELVNARDASVSDRAYDELAADGLLVEEQEMTTRRHAKLVHEGR